MLRELLRRVEMKVIQENRLDVVVRLHTSLPPGKIGLAPLARAAGRYSRRHPHGAVRRRDRSADSRGLRATVYDATFVLSPDRRRYIATNSDTPTTLPAPGLPFSLVFRAEPGAEDRDTQVASAYEAASKRRVPPPRFGAVSQSSAPSNGKRLITGGDHADGSPAGWPLPKNREMLIPGVMPRTRERPQGGPMLSTITRIGGFAAVLGCMASRRGRRAALRAISGTVFDQDKAVLPASRSR